MQTSQSKIEWPIHDSMDVAVGAAIDALASAHYAVIPNFLSANMQQALHNELLQQQEKGFFHEAGIGRGIQQARNVDIRGSIICDS